MSVIVLSYYVMRRYTAQYTQGFERRRAGAYDAEVAITDAGGEADIVVANLGVQRGDQRPRLLARDMIGREIAHAALIERYEVASEDEFVRRWDDPLVGGFQRRTAGERLARVVSEDRKVSDVTT